MLQVEYYDAVVAISKKLEVASQYLNVSHVQYGQNGTTI